MSSLNMKDQMEPWLVSPSKDFLEMQFTPRKDFLFLKERMYFLKGNWSIRLQSGSNRA